MGQRQPNRDRPGPKNLRISLLQRLVERCGIPESRQAILMTIEEQTIKGSGNEVHPDTVMKRN